VAPAQELITGSEKSRQRYASARQGASAGINTRQMAQPLLGECKKFHIRCAKLRCNALI